MLYFSQKLPSTNRLYGVDAWRLLKIANTTIQSVVVTVTTINGFDANPQDLYVPASVSFSDGQLPTSLIKFRLRNGLAGVTYLVTLTITCVDTQVVPGQVAIQVVNVLS